MDLRNQRRNNLPRRQARQKELIVLMGTFLQIDHWQKCGQQSSIFEIVGEVTNFYRRYPTRVANVNNPLTMVLRDRARRRTLKILYANDCPTMPELAVGSLVRCIGKVEHRNIMRAFRINMIQPNEVADLERIRYVCQHAAGGNFV